MPRRLLSALVLAVTAAALSGCGGGSGGGAAPAGTVAYHEPARGWAAGVPAGWRSVALGPTFVRGDPLADPTRLVIEAYPGRSPASALHAATGSLGVRVGAAEPGREGEHVDRPGEIVA